MSAEYMEDRARRARDRRRRRRIASGDRGGGEGVSVGLVCKSLLGKAHTVMAEGGMAAAMGNVDDRDNWRVHFADTMRGGQYLNNWRMAETARQGSAGAREGARSVGRVVRSHAGRPNSAAQLRRTPVSAARARRRPHGARADSHAAGSRRASRARRVHGVHGRSRCSTTAIACRARSRTIASAGAFACSRRRPSCWRRAASAARSRSRRTAGSTPATGMRSPITPAPRCRTWSSSSSIRRG